MADDHGDASVVDRNLLLLCWCVILLLNNYYNTCKEDCTCTRQKNACDCEWLTALSATGLCDGKLNLACPLFGALRCFRVDIFLFIFLKTLQCQDTDIVWTVVS